LTTSGRNERAAVEGIAGCADQAYSHSPLKQVSEDRTVWEVVAIISSKNSFLSWQFCQWLGTSSAENNGASFHESREQTLM